MQRDTPGSAMKPAERLAFALDVASWDEAAPLVDALAGTVGVFKIGLQLFTAAGPSPIKRLRDRGSKVFLDLKLHDIPATVQHATEAALKHDVNYLTLHVSAGSEALRAAAKAARGSEMQLLGVTLLTSLDEVALGEIGMRGPTPEAVVRLARLAVDAGLSGLVCSPIECELIRAELGNDLLLVTPGIRPSGSSEGDQKRLATPTHAIACGADVLVVGRPIRDAKDPKAAAIGVLREIETAAGATVGR
ncbi:MAG TPA: orotidine-5'-phosphate decarboxylase [Polyangiales bacterium]|jgi:orotidine-5'-phosphate decarboxylase|nr:orotidine-5'-phosphate decarboxylase [Polyangiales bacterium]